MGGTPRTTSASDQHVQLTRGASYLIIQSLGVNVVTIVSFAVLARVISTKEMGIWAILQLVNATCLALITWFPAAVTKYVAENDSKGTKPVAAAAFYQCLRVNVVMYVPIIVAIYFGAAFLAIHLLGDASYASLFQILAFDTLFYAGLLPTLTAALFGLRMFREVAAVGLVVGGFVRQFVIILLIIFMKSFVGLVIGWLVSDAASALILMSFVVRALGAPRFDFSLVKLFRYYLPLELSTIVGFAQTWFDRALLVVFVPLATLGIYNAALTAFGVLGSVSGSMTNMLFPAYSSIQEKAGVWSSMRDAIRLATRYACFTLTPLAFGLLATAKPAITLFVGEAYVGGYSPLVIFCGGFAVTVFSTALGPVFLALEETKTAAVITGVTVVISLAVAYIFLPLWGIEGASAARALSTILAAIVTVLVLQRKIALSLDFEVIAKTFVAGTTMAAVLWVVQFVSYSKFMLPAYVLIGAIVYLVMLRLLKAVDTADLNLLQRFLGTRLLLVSKILNWILTAA